MNKKLAVVLAALMMLTSTTFLANESGNTVDNSLTDGYVANDISAIVPEDVVEEAEELAVGTTDKKAELLAVYDVQGETGKPVKVAVAGVKKGDNIVVLHWDVDAQKWESASVSNVIVEDGAVTATYAKLSPVAFVKVTAAVAGGVIEELVNGPVLGATPALPKTGAVAVLPVAALACLAGAVACGRKEK